MSARWDEDVPLPDPRKDRPVTLSHRAEDLAAGMLFDWSGQRDVVRASDGLGRFARGLGPRLPSVHARGRRNLALVLPDMPAAQHEAILLDAWENLGRTAAEYSHLPELWERTDTTGDEAISRLADSGGQAVFVSAHMANWEVMAVALHRLGLRTAVVYRAANNPLVDARIIGLRAAALSRRMIPKGRRGGRELLQAVKDGLSICMLTDQKLSDGVRVPFMGHPAMTAPAAARLALKSDLPILPLQLVREPGVRFRLTVHEPIEADRSGDVGAATERLTAAINAKLGEMILQHPGQWLWFHRRWPRELTG